MNKLVIALTTLIALSPIAALAQDQPQTVATDYVTGAPDNSAAAANAITPDSDASYVLLLGLGGN